MSSITLRFTNLLPEYEAKLYRDIIELNVSALPLIPLAENIVGDTYIDNDVEVGKTYFYGLLIKVGSDLQLLKSKKVMAITDNMPELDQSIKPYAFWKLNEKTGNYIDSSGNNNTLLATPNAIRNIPSIDKTGQICSSINSAVADEDARIIGSFVSSVSVGFNFTVSMWIQVPDKSVNNAGEFFKLHSENGRGFSVGFGNGSDNQPPLGGRYINIGQNYISFRSTTAKFPDTQTNANLVIRWNNGILDIFIDGKRVSTRNVGNYNSANRSIRVGRGELSQKMNFNIKMSRVAVYDGALSDQDISNIFEKLITKIQ